MNTNHDAGLRPIKLTQGTYIDSTDHVCYDGRWTAWDPWTNLEAFGCTMEEALGYLILAQPAAFDILVYGDVQTTVMPGNTPPPPGVSE